MHVFHYYSILPLPKKDSIHLYVQTMHYLAIVLSRQHPFTRVTQLIPKFKPLHNIRKLVWYTLFGSNSPKFLMTKFIRQIYMWTALVQNQNHYCLWYEDKFAAYYCIINKMVVVMLLQL